MPINSKANKRGVRISLNLTKVKSMSPLTFNSEQSAHRAFNLSRTVAARLRTLSRLRVIERDVGGLNEIPVTHVQSRRGEKGGGEQLRRHAEAGGQMFAKDEEMNKSGSNTQESHNGRRC